MCTRASPNLVLFQVNDMQFKIPTCHVVCCDMEKKDMEDWMQVVTQPIQTTFQAKQFEFKVRDLTTQLAHLTKKVEAMPVRKPG